MNLSINMNKSSVMKFSAKSGNFETNELPVSVNEETGHIRNNVTF